MVNIDDAIIREANEGDIAGIATVLDGTLGQDFRFGEHGFKEEVDYLFSRAIEDRNETVYVAQYGKKIVGFAYFINKPPANGTAILEMFAVHKDLHGQGIGSKLIKDASDRFIAQEKARGVNLRTIHLTTGDYNKGAQRIYNQAGFFKVSEIPGFVGQGNVEFVMLRNVNDSPCPENYRSR